MTENVILNVNKLKKFNSRDLRTATWLVQFTASLMKCIHHKKDGHKVTNIGHVTWMLQSDLSNSLLANY